MLELFDDRKDAGEQLAKKLLAFKGATNTIVLALPRGGVVVGRVVADALDLPLDIVVPRKIGAEGNEEYAIGAITEKGDAVWNEAERSQASMSYLERRMEEERQEAARRLAVYRQGRPPRDLQGKTTLLVDDGIATGLTMRAAIATATSEGAARTVVSVPVCPPDALKLMKQVADDVIVLQVPKYFSAIGAFYRTFPQVEDEEVIKLL